MHWRHCIIRKWGENVKIRPIKTSPSIYCKIKLKSINRIQQCSARDSCKCVVGYYQPMMFVFIFILCVKKCTLFAYFHLILNLLIYLFLGLSYLSITRPWNVAFGENVRLGSWLFQCSWFDWLCLQGMITRCGSKIYNSPRMTHFPILESISS